MKFKVPISAIITISFGIIVLAGYFIEAPMLAIVRQLFLQWAIIIAAMALLVGVLNLLSVHWRKTSSGQKGSFYSAILLVGLFVTIGVAGYFGPTAAWSLWIFNNIQIPVESSLMAVLSVALVYAGLRLVRRRLNLFVMIFLGTSILVLLGSAPLFGVSVPGLHGPFSIRALLLEIPAVAGARGILLGVALGGIATGLRVLLGAERPYRG